MKKKIIDYIRKDGATALNVVLFVIFAILLMGGSVFCVIPLFVLIFKNKNNYEL